MYPLVAKVCCLLASTCYRATQRLPTPADPPFCSLYGCGDLACLAAALPRLQQLRLRSVQLLPQSLSELAPLAPSLTALELLAMHNQHHLELQHVSALTQLRQLVGADLQSEPPYWHGEEEEADPGGQASVLRHQQVLTSALGGLQQLTRLELRRLQGCLYDAAEALMGQLPGSLAELAWRQLALGDGLGDQQLLRSCSAWRCLQQLEVRLFRAARVLHAGRCTCAHAAGCACRIHLPAAEPLNVQHHFCLKQ